MPRVTGPAFSLSAYGSLAETLTWRRWRGRHVLERKPAPTGTASASQRSRRLMYQFLAHQWPTLPAPAVASWTIPAELAKITPYNAYLSENLRRWKRWQAPGQTYPVAETGTQPGINEVTSDGKVRSVLHVQGVSPANDAWAVTIYHGPSAIWTPTRDDLVAVVALNVIDRQIFTEHNVPPGEHWYNLRYFTLEGAFDIIQGPWSNWPLVTDL